ncbi:MAG: exosortase/archaeosortase family protein [Planctomycetota bacterium]
MNYSPPGVERLSGPCPWSSCLLSSSSSAINLFELTGSASWAWFVWYLAGSSVIRVTWLPILFLTFAMPIPPTLYSRIAVPLQNFAARFSAIILQIFGVVIDITASRMSITSMGGNQYGLTVAEACSGVRSLMAFLALGVAWAYLENRAIWQRAVLVASAVPVAILCNVIRVTITSSMYVFDKPELGQDFMHEFTGILMLAPALAMFWGLSKLLESIFVEVEDGGSDGG